LTGGYYPEAPTLITPRQLTPFCRLKGRNAKEGTLLSEQAVRSRWMILIKFDETERFSRHYDDQQRTSYIVRPFFVPAPLTTFEQSR
jgi:hypothetical protein